jgi:hypothetical protein
MDGRMIVNGELGRIGEKGPSDAGSRIDGATAM